MIHNHPYIFGFPPRWCWRGSFSSASFKVPGYMVGESQTYSLVLLGGPERVLPMAGYLDTCFFLGQEAANMAPPKTSRREPPHAMKMAAPNSNLERQGNPNPQLQYYEQRQNWCVNKVTCTGVIYAVVMFQKQVVHQCKESKRKNI